MENHIELYRAAGCWNARFRGPGAQAIIDAFGTDTLPTAYTDRAPLDVVRAAIEELNPGMPIVACGKP